MSPREIARITSDSRRIRLMEDYIAKHGGQFVWNQHTGWSYVAEQVIDNKLEKTEKRAEQRQKEAVRKSFFRKHKNNEEETE